MSNTQIIYLVYSQILTKVVFIKMSGNFHKDLIKTITINYLHLYEYIKL